MATANELLATMADNGVDKTLIIDNDLRTIIIPKSVTNLGTEFEKNVHRLHFQMPRYFGDIDLSELNIRINYMNANSECDIYVVTDKKVLSSTITFSWLVGAHALMYKGPVNFIVCLKKSNTAGEILKEFNTTPASLPVLEGLEVDTAALEKPMADILEQLLALTEAKVSEVEAAGAEQITKVSAKSVEEQEKIVNKGAEVLATIPEDYQTTTKLANEGVRSKADAIICSTEGETITVHDSSDDYIRGLKIFGKTTQIKTTGKNLLKNTQWTQGGAGITFTVNDDATITVNGTATEIAYIPIGVTLEPNTEYILSGCPSGGSSTTYSAYMIDKTTFNKMYHDYGSSVRFNTGTETNWEARIRVAPGTTLSNKVFKLMIRLATVEDSSWEPYTGGMPSPNPDYPQDLVSVENPTVNICGKNLVDFACFSGSDNYIALVNVSDLRSVKKGKQYTLSVYLHATAETRAYWNDAARLYGYLEFDVAAGTNRYTYSFTAKEDGDLYEVVSNVVNKYPTSDDVVVTALNAQLEFGDKATEYEPYKVDLLPITTPSTLPGIPVTSGGNYTDENGQQWICDEIDFERGVYVKRVNTRTFDGNESWLIGEQNIEEGYIGIFYTAANDMVPGGAAQCTHYRRGDGVGLLGKDGQFDTYYSQFRINIGVLTSVDEWVNQLAEWNMAGKPLVLSYILDTPIETPLTADELAAFQALKTNYPNTTVMNDSGAWMNLRYNADTETWITNLIDEKIAAAVAKL